MPLPLLPDMIDIQLAVSLVVQLQPLGAVKLTVPVPPMNENDLLVGEMEYVQEIPLWVTVKVFPAIVMVPVRELVLEFESTE